jgi:hypothetical protein
VSAERVRCPTCARAYPASERFCEVCGMPLVQDAGATRELSPAQLQARKIKPQYAEGRPVFVARARNLAEAEFLAGLLLEEGIPSYSNSAIAGHGGLAGRRDILVPESAAEAAREALSPQPEPSEED